MKNILIYEYITGGGIINEDLTHDLLYEAELILESLINDFSKIKTIDFKYLLDYRLKDRYGSSNSIIVKESDYNFTPDIYKNFNYVLPILPESHNILYHYSRFLEKNRIKKILSSSEIIKVMSDKKLFSNFCKKAKIKHPLLISDISKIKKNKLYVIKDRFGVGCSRIQIISGKDLKHFDSKKYIIQEYIKGKSFSASIFCSSGNFIILSFNEHQIKKNKNNYIKINKIIVNRNISNHPKICGLLNKLKNNVSSLSGYIGIDFIITDDDIYIIELNPRITTSFTKLNSTLGINLAGLINNSNIITPICGKTSRINLL